MDINTTLTTRFTQKVDSSNAGAVKVAETKKRGAVNALLADPRINPALGEKKMTVDLSKPDALRVLIVDLECAVTAVRPVGVAVDELAVLDDPARAIDLEAHLESERLAQPNDRCVCVLVGRGRGETWPALGSWFRDVNAPQVLNGGAR